MSPMLDDRRSSFSSSGCSNDRTNTYPRNGQTTIRISDIGRCLKEAERFNVQDKPFINIICPEEQKRRKKIYPKILVPLDGSKFGERAIQQAEEIGQSTKAEIILFQVVQNPIRSVPIATFMDLKLGDQDKTDLVEFLKSL